MESQRQLKAAIHDNWQRYLDLMPDVAEAYAQLPQAAYAPGKIDAKTKRVMAVAIAVTQGCRACMLFQTEKALELGAEPMEILEACAVAISLGGTMAAGETTRVVQHLEELGKL